MKRVPGGERSVAGKHNSRNHRVAQKSSALFGQAVIFPSQTRVKNRTRMLIFCPKTMRKHSIVLACLITEWVLGLTLSASTLHAQEKAPAVPGPNAQTSTPSLTVVISVRGKGDNLSSLTASDFEIQESGKAAVVTELVSKGRNENALHYCILLDTSNSEREAFVLKQEVAYQLLEKAVRDGRDVGWLAGFDVEPHQGSETQSLQKIREEIASTRVGGATALYDAVYACAERMAKSSYQSGYRTMFILSDGDDNMSHATRDQAIAAVVQSGVRVYAFGDPLGTRQGAAALQLFAVASGGRAYLPSSKWDAAMFVKEVAEDLATSYEIRFSVPTLTSGNPIRTLEVKCHKKGVSLIAPRLHYAR